MRSIVLASAVFLSFAAAPVFALDDLSFGDDSSEYSNDGECDDPRFVGKGMTSTPLLSEDILTDATDCRAAFEAGTITLNGVAEDGTIDFGDDAGDFANDGECDDLRFTGPGLTETALLQEDILHDASDCRKAFKAGQLTLLLK